MKTKHKWRLRAAFALVLTAMLLAAVLPVGAAERTRIELYVGGIPFGVRFFTEGILVVGYCDVESGGGCHNPARAAGLSPGDCIYKINEETPHTAAELSAILQKQRGEITVGYKREGEEREATLTPLACDEDGKLRMGLFVRDSGAGIGTVTFVTEKGHTFAGLGHGICDGESGTLIPLSRGSVMGVTIGSITRGAVGAPGELRGHFSAGKIGSLLGNTLCGVYGVLAELPQLPAGKCEIAYKDEVHEGAATVWCTLDDNVCRPYDVQLSQIHRAAEGNKCFTVKVTDKDLLARTGGIVQGMSGSPILQDGRLVGAITHVLIGDPTTGYGIFIENMLNAAQSQEQSKAA
ncbi:MAG: SpoIVB peptidase [Ruminococcaceae bacterium]|nr:SpoIVB peptidase [Oscillospiraceae bacterium]